MTNNRISLALLAFGISLVYSVVRYHIAGTVPWNEFPVYVLNKAVSLCALAFFAFSYRAGRTRWIPAGSGAFFGAWGFVLMNLHLILTALVWDASHYGKLFEASVPKQLTNYSMLLGAVGVAAFCSPMWATAKSPSWRWWKTMQSLGYFGLALTALHVGMIGFGGWWTPSAWPGYLPPITLISVVLAAWPIVARRMN